MYRNIFGYVDFVFTNIEETVNEADAIECYSIYEKNEKTKSNSLDSSRRHERGEIQLLALSIFRCEFEFPICIS